MLKSDFFSTQLPPSPKGKYAHIIMLRETQGYALFQTDGALNMARVQAGVKDESIVNRITMFRRKQTTPERLNGRERLRLHGLLQDMEDMYGDKSPKDVRKDTDARNKKLKAPPFGCFYNVHACKRCPDCMTYGFAIGGSEKSKVLSDTAYSLSDYASSHEVFTLNAPYEDGTTTDTETETSKSLAQQDFVKPQVIFPSIMVTRDLTEDLFSYVLQNILRTSRYGATTSRGGTMKNHIVAIVLSDGEIFSNLLFTQTLHDSLNHKGNDPIKLRDALTTSREIIPSLLANDGVRDSQVMMGSDLEEYLGEFNGRTLDQERDSLINAANQTFAYYKTHIQSKEGKSED